MILNWLAHKGLRFVQTLNDREQEKYSTSTGPFEVLSENFKPQHNKTTLSLQYCKLIREERESTEEWVGCPKIKGNLARDFDIVWCKIFKLHSIGSVKIAKLKIKLPKLKKIYEYTIDTGSDDN